MSFNALLDFIQSIVIFEKKSKKEERETLICVFESGYYFLSMQMEENACLFVSFYLI